MRRQVCFCHLHKALPVVANRMKQGAAQPSHIKSLEDECSNERLMMKRGNIMGNNVIQFPKKQSWRKRLQDKTQDQKAVLSLSIASVLVMSLFLNQWVIGNTNKTIAAVQGSRQIASFEGNFAQDMKWEHDLARELSQKDLQDSAKLAEKPTMRDELIFGYLQGKYGMKLAQGRIESLEFIDAQAGEQPLAIAKKADFLLSYRDAFGLDYRQASLSQKSNAEEVYNLVNDNKAIVGSAHFALDDQGRVVSVKIIQ